MTEKQKFIVYFARLIVSILSTIGICYIFVTFIASYVYKHEKKNNGTDQDLNREKFAHGMIFAIAISNLLSCIATFIYTTPYETIQPDTIQGYYCIAQAFLYTISEISTVCLTTVFSFFIYLGSVWERKFESTHLYIAYGVVPGFLLSILPLPGLLNIYGQAGSWCWLGSENKDDLFKVKFLSAFMISFCWALMIANICFMILVYYYYLKKNADALEIRKRFLLYLLSYPLILVFCWAPGTFNRIYELFYEKYSFEYFLLTAITLSIMGFLNFLVYLFGIVQEVFSKITIIQEVQPTISLLPNNNELNQDANN